MFPPLQLLPDPPHFSTLSFYFSLEYKQASKKINNKIK